MRVSFKEFSSLRPFGIEVEVSASSTKEELRDALSYYELFCNKKPRQVKMTAGKKGWAETNNNNYWHIKYDSTCGSLESGHNFGWEVASYIGSGLSDLTSMSDALHFLGECGVKVNRNCGLHVHVQVADFNPSLMGLLLARWLKIEPLLFHSCPYYRRKSSHCRKLRSKVSIKRLESFYRSEDPEMFEKLWAVFSPTDFSTHNNYQKKVSLNTIGFAIGLQKPHHSRITVELRLPEASLNRADIKNWVILILNFVESCRKSRGINIPSNLSVSSSLSDSLSLLGLGSKGEFLILDDNLNCLKKWFLNRLICFSSSKRVVLEANKEFDLLKLS